VLLHGSHGDRVDAAIGMALGIELGQVLLPGKYPDTTDWFLESVGGLLGYVLFRLARNKLLPGNGPRWRGPSRMPGQSR